MNPSHGPTDHHGASPAPQQASSTPSTGQPGNRTDVAPTGPNKVGLERSVGRWMLTLTGYASVVASGFMIGVGGSATAAGPLALVSYWVIGALATFSVAFCYAELATMFPRSGGVWEYMKQAFGEDHPVSFTIGWIYWFALLFGLNVELVSIGIYLNELVPAIPQWVGALAAALLFFLINWLGVQLSTLVEAAFGLILILSFSTFILVGLFNIHGANYANFAPNGVFMPLVQTLPFVVIAFCGFDVSVTLAEESTNPNRDIPRALITAAAFLTVLFGAFTTVLFGLLPATDLTSQAPLIKAGAIVFGAIGAIWLSVQSFAGSLSTVNGGVIGQTRMLYAMAREGWFPRSMATVDPRTHTPRGALAITGISMVIVSFLPLITEKAWQWAGFLGVFGYGLVYATVAFLVIHLRRTRPDAERPFRVPLYPLTPIVAIVLYLVAIIASGWGVVAVGVVWCLVGVVYYYVIARPSRRRWLATNSALPEAAPQ